MVVHPGSNDHLRIRNLIHGDMLSLLSKKQRNGKVSLKNGIIGIDNKMIINTLMKHFYVAVRYFYITNRLIPRDISRVIYKLIEVMESNYFTQALQRKLININKLELMTVNVIKSIKSK